MRPKTNIIFESKRNHCYYDKLKGCVIKQFKNKECYFIEKEMLESLEAKNEIRTPKLLAFNEDIQTLEIEYIDGLLVLEQLEKYESKNLVKDAVFLLNSLITWLNLFYQINSNKVYGDINLRNFIITKEGIAGIDLEQCCIGNNIEELEYLLAMYVLYDPKETRFKQEVSSIVCEQHHINKDHVNKQMKKIMKRRKTI